MDLLLLKLYHVLERACVGYESPFTVEDDEMASRKRFSTSYVLSKLDLSDDNCFDDNDSDRESDNALGNVEPDSDVDSNVTEDYIPVLQTAAAAAAGNDSHDSDLDSEHGNVDARVE